MAEPVVTPVKVFTRDPESPRDMAKLKKRLDEIAAITPIANPSGASTEDVANKLNEILTAVADLAD